MTATALHDRAVIRLVSPDGSEDVVAFLQGLVTNDIAGDLPVYAALLTPQGKMLFDFFVWPAPDDGLLLDCESEAAEDLVKRLSLYRLRRKIDIARDEGLTVHWAAEAGDGGARDPRLAALGQRWIAPKEDSDASADQAYLKHRLSLGVPEGRREMADTLWLETNAVELNGVSFGKGCYIGQENTARMNWRQKVNRRLIVLPLERSEEKRRRAEYAELGYAVDHLRVADIDPNRAPDWMRSGLTPAE